jgi:hypothetical protein
LIGRAKHDESSVDITFFKNELLRMSVPLLRTIDLDALQIFKAVVDFGGVKGLLHSCIGCLQTLRPA